jgi:hypothetical protein
MPKLAAWLQQLMKMLLRRDAAAVVLAMPRRPVVWGCCALRLLASLSWLLLRYPGTKKPRC